MGAGAGAELWTQWHYSVVQQGTGRVSAQGTSQQSRGKALALAGVEVVAAPIEQE